MTHDDHSEYAEAEEAALWAKIQERWPHLNDTVADRLCLFEVVSLVYSCGVKAGRFAMLEEQAMSSEWASGQDADRP